MKNKWRKILADNAGSEEYFCLTSIIFAFSERAKYFIEKYQSGYTIDIGAGHSPYRILCNDEKYISIDISKSNSINIIGDAHVLPIKDETFDTALCFLMLEHTKRPLKILKEIDRILKHSGVVILAVPHITYLHAEPNDYYRFTKYGLRYICEESGFKIDKIMPIGGVFSLFGTFISKILLTATYKIPVIYKIALFFNKLIINIILYLDNHFDNDKIFALNYIAILSKSDKPFEIDG